MKYIFCLIFVSVFVHVDVVCQESDSTMQSKFESIYSDTLKPNRLDKDFKLGVNDTLLKKVASELANIDSTLKDYHNSYIKLNESGWLKKTANAFILIPGLILTILSIIVSYINLTDEKFIDKYRTHLIFFVIFLVSLIVLSVFTSIFFGFASLILNFINTILFAMLVGALIFAVIIYFTNTSEEIEPEKIEDDPQDLGLSSLYDTKFDEYDIRFNFLVKVLTSIISVDPTTELSGLSLNSEPKTKLRKLTLEFGLYKNQIANKKDYEEVEKEIADFIRKEYPNYLL